jgi:hypothetical protein
LNHNDDSDDEEDEEEGEEYLYNLSDLISYRDKIPLNQITRYQGEKVRLFCIDYGFRPDGVLKWRKNDAFYSLKKDKKAYVNNFNEFVIEKLEFKHAGTYECLFDEKIVLEIELKVLPLFMKEYENEDNFEHEDNEHMFELFKKITAIFACILFVRSINSVVSDLGRKNKSKANNSDLVKFNNLFFYFKKN